MLHNADDSPAPAPTWNPPPHLEARFSRKRRRPTGAHSPCAVPLTTASTLATTRRQMLLDSRKSLLRQRAQHVEKVRRARANSHEAVGARLLALQQALSQAQKSRNAILARIAGSCASEVAKAKRLAGETRERREREARALRSGVEERMLEAERRRMEVLSERRGRRRTGGASGTAVRVDGVSDVEEEGLVVGAAATAALQRARRKSVEETRGEAARCIQRVWRGHVRGEIVKRFLGLGLTIESVRDTSFEDISNKFQEEGVQKATARLLKLCGLLGSSVAEGEGEGEVDVEVACRTFLSAYLILGHPAEVLSNDGDNEKALITKSKDLLIAFESLLSAPTFPPAKHLAETWESFSTAFTSWKARDSEILVSTMVAQYAELDLIWQKVKDDTEGHVAADFKEVIRENQLILLVRIRRLAGEKTRGLIRQAIKEARRTRLPKKEKGDTRPRETPSSSESNTVSTAVTAAEAGVANTPASPIADQPSIPIAAAAAAAAPTHGDPTHDDTFSRFSTTSGALGNRQIVHELALNRDFKLTQRRKPPLEQLVEREAKRAFWDLMRADVLQGRNLSKWLPPMAHSVKTKLLHLLDPAGSLHCTIADAIDVDLITQQCQHGTYDHERFFAFVLALLPRICSPARDGDVQALLGHTGDYIDRLQRLFDVLELLQLDHANFLLMASAQYVIPEAAPYERRLFSADLAAGRTLLTRTTAWLRAAQVAARAEAEAAGRARPTPIQVWNYAFLGLVATLDTTLLTPDTAPETLHLDVDRINGFRHTFRTIATGAAITITTKNLLRRDVRSAWRPLKERVAVLLAGAAVEGGEDGDGDGGAAALADGICVFLTETVATPKSVLGHVAGAVGRIVARGGADPVVRLVEGRVRGFVGERLGAEGSRERVRLATGGGETLSGFGMAEWIGEVGGLVDAVVGCGGVNRDVYREWYDAVLVE
ncbi:T-complex protein 11-domain-containing protein [Morchella snyderi]|nr:T-complex protein 11-domain-containing protein [Morchella snyderi]